MVGSETADRDWVPDSLQGIEILWEFVVRCVSSGAFPFLDSRKICDRSSEVRFHPMKAWRFSWGQSYTKF